MDATAVLLGFLVLLGVTSGFRLPGRITSLGTFNAAILPQYPQSEERVELLIDLIEKSKLDVICLQEVWRTDYQRRIYSALRHHYPYYVSLINLTAVEDPNSPRACSLADVQSYGGCLIANCNSSTPATCVIDRCLDILAPLSTECKLCLLINIGTSNGSIEKCVTEPVTNYERTFGLMLLSKKEIIVGRAQGYLGDDSEARGFYQASIAEVGEVFCTHLSTPAGAASDYVGPPIVSPYRYNSYAEQQYRELVTLLDAAAVTDSSILLGDFNHGPTIATLPGVSSVLYEMPFNYGYVNARGYYSPNVLLDRRCTICSENLAVSITSRIVDHIYVPVTSSDRVVASVRMWDDQFTGTGLPLSDHYGVQLILRELSLCTSIDWTCMFCRGRNTFPALGDPDEELGRVCLALE